MRRNGLHADLVEKLRVDDELHRSIRVEDRAGTAATVPLEEALILDTAEQRRKLILSVLTEDPVQYYDLLQQARMNDDSEVVHYAATAMAQISKQADLALQQDARRFADDPNDREVLAAYANALERSLKLGLAQGRAAELQRRQLERLLKLSWPTAPERRATASAAGWQRCSCNCRSTRLRSRRSKSWSAAGRCGKRPGCCGCAAPPPGKAVPKCGASCRRWSAPRST